ncbi:MAG TPA: hypothetical protein VN718_04925, partial [Rhizomicrobium sp.]|nr:hypothetical protein [Rhizomicrobium sp.]
MLTQSHAGAAKASAPVAPSSAARAIALDLAPLIAPYRRRARLSLRIENLPQGARLSAGRNNGDRSWSLALDELDELFYVLPEHLTDDHVLALRLVAKEESNASTLALIDLPVRAGNFVALPPPSFGHRQREALRSEAPRSEAAKADTLKQEISALKAELAGRDQELSQARAASQSLDGNWQAKLEKAIAAAKTEWRSAEASRLAAARADHEKEVSSFHELKDHVTAAHTLLSEREGELAALKAELTEQRQKSEAEISAATKALDVQSALDAQRREQSAKLLQELKRRCDEAEASLIRQRQKSEAEIAAARTALKAQGARETDKQDQAGAALAELTARCQSAEAELDRQRENLEAEINAAHRAAEEQDAAEARRARHAAGALAELQARCEAAEASLRSAQTAREKAEVDDAYVRGLNQEIKNLQTVLVDREAAIARAEASLEQMQVGAVARPAPAHWEPLPGGLSRSHDQDNAKRPDSHLVRDFVLVFAVVGLGCLAYFFGPSLLASTGWQLPALSNLFAANDDDQAPAPMPAVPAAPPKPDHPQGVVIRDVNLR